MPLVENCPCCSHRIEPEKEFVSVDNMTMLIKCQYRCCMCGVAFPWVSVFTCDYDCIYDAEQAVENLALEEVHKWAIVRV